MKTPPPAHAKAERMAHWRRYLDDHDSRFNYPEVHRSMCRLISQDMLNEQIISAAEKFELDEIADAAYWHAVETLIDCEPDFMPSGFYDLVARDGSPSIGRLSGSIYYPAGSSDYAAQVIGERGSRRLVFRMTGDAWKMDGMTITTPDGRAHDLVITGQRINGIEYTNIDDPDVYRALADSATLALENHHFETYRRARPLLLAAAFKKCPECLDQFAAREDCKACAGRGFVVRGGPGSTV
ncbi:MULTISPECIES: hypothetical protein [unclassified Pseudomonas]|uniref:hypothetical protein n=1 Tax=unclassified Pseudomonas TaxID=196821 RepID=UPI000838B41C|nr:MULTISPECIES: hypothetical protein [unclassified Pseudomonas]QIH07180.1 hypothetical protein ATY02_10825 [Pseudomonas sp. BIOMIG1BAC]